ncbi:FkbM family methyltransferase [Roseibium hamelinense]|uniref:FkbM family methyltransferase n=1 Tax=Roseibium hamelinense TaxID=150831 RepID=A0A562SZC7_9HYPH|nr:FkbM family methyltransferase [Roseibium hamelinense]MTI44788.1 FkbM family methyltransferase [Roseibium hamelinense]TWI86020.1 FkbM family methyltransferase [Roseibium hamelinense]
MNPEDLFRKYAAEKGQLSAKDGYFTNFLGVFTRADIFPPHRPLSGQVFADLPIRGDGVFGGYGDYFSLFSALDKRAGQETLTVCELGAGWGPWTSASGVIGQRMGFKRINLVAVEADHEKFQYLQEHLAFNGLTGKSNINIRLLEGAAWHQNTTLHFPRALRTEDYGGRVTDGAHSVDYRGMQYESVEIPAHSLEAIFEGLDTIDFLHVDIQGAEYEVLSRNKDLLEQKVRSIFIGTHSRKIDAQMLELFFEWGWDVPRLVPCVVTYDRTKPTLEGMTAADGEMFVTNPKLY